jgi:hypothetical protein
MNEHTQLGMPAALSIPLWILSRAAARLIGKAKGYPYRGFVPGTVLSALKMTINAQLAERSEA